MNKIQKGISFKVILIGDSGSGKTSLIHQYIHGKFKDEYQVTVGVDFASKTILIDNEAVQLQIWDTCGQDIYKSITSSFYRGASAVFLVYAIDSRQSFNNVSKWLEQFRDKGSKNAFIFLIGSKSDLQRNVTQEQALQFMKKQNGAFFIETSALTGQNVQQLFHKAADTMYKYYTISKDYRQLVKPDRISQVPVLSALHEQQGVKPKKKCCN